MEPVTGLTILGSAIGGAKVVEKLLGPTSEYIGEQIKEWTKKRVENTSKIFQNAEKKLGDEINGAGQVPPKVLKSVLEDGAWCEEELQIEYFGGVLASSRSNSKRDDRGAYYAALVNRLSTYQIRTHYIFYQALKYHFNGNKLNIAESETRNRIRIFISFEAYYKLMEFSESETQNKDILLSHSIWGLDKEALIQNSFSYGPVEFLKTKYGNVIDSGIVFQPSKLGIDLLMWAFGHGKLSQIAFFNKDISFDSCLNLNVEDTIVL